MYYYTSELSVFRREKRFERGAFPGRGYDEEIPNHRRDFSRSLSSDSWRESKHEEEDENGGWRKMGPKDRWSEYGISYGIDYTVDIEYSLYS